MIENELNEIDEIKDNIKTSLEQKGISLSDETPFYEYSNGVGLIKFNVDDFLSNVSENLVQNKVITNALDGKAPLQHTHTKSEITDFPTIPTITDTYSATSSNGMSGKAVASAITNKADISSLPTKLTDLTDDLGTSAVHTHKGSAVKMTGYSKPSSTSAITTSDTVNSAIGKLEKALDGIESVLDSILGT